MTGTNITSKPKVGDFCGTFCNKSSDSDAFVGLNEQVNNSSLKPETLTGP